jgi:VIT1/CCC1 family predicted Fe2+/Mn2+ transporter
MVDKAREETGDKSTAYKMRRFSKDDAYTVLAIMSCDALAVVPVILPYVLLGYTTLALLLSIMIASTAMAYIIFQYAKHTGRRKWLAAGIFFVFMVIASLLAYYYGW